MVKVDFWFEPDSSGWFCRLRCDVDPEATSVMGLLRLAQHRYQIGLVQPELPNCWACSLHNLNKLQSTLITEKAHDIIYVHLSPSSIGTIIQYDILLYFTHLCVFKPRALSGLFVAITRSSEKSTREHESFQYLFKWFMIFDMSQLLIVSTLAGSFCVVMCVVIFYTQ